MIECFMCGDRAIHLAEEKFVCCWCWIVELAHKPHEGHEGCLVAKKRIEKIQVRFRTAVLSERECCAKIVEEAKNPTAAMPKRLEAAFRRTPDYAMRAVLDTLVKNLTALIRARVDPIPDANGRSG